MQKLTESKIKGTFRGWPGRGVFELANGEIWEQVEYNYLYRNTDQPQATVWRDGSRCFLQVEGMCEMVQVRKI